VTCLISDILRHQQLIVSARTAEGREVGVIPTSRSGGLCRTNARRRPLPRWPDCSRSLAKVPPCPVRAGFTPRVGVLYVTEVASRQDPFASSQQRALEGQHLTKKLIGFGAYVSRPNGRNISTRVIETG
jgi:hypothetical protein